MLTDEQAMAKRARKLEAVLEAAKAVVACLDEECCQPPSRESVEALRDAVEAVENYASAGQTRRGRR